MTDATLQIDGAKRAKAAEPSEAWRIRHEREWGEVIGSVTDAASFSPLDWPRSVFGNLSSMGPARHSEFGLLWSGNIPRLARYLRDTLIPSVPGSAPKWVPAPFSGLLFHRSRELKSAAPAQARTFDGERWFFINGILTNQDVARINVAYLVDLFHRPITVLWDPSDGAVVDLIECASEKLGATDQDVNRDFHPLLDAIANPELKRVVLIAHSRGTLITAVLLRLVREVYRRTMTGKQGQLTRSDREAVSRHAAAAGLTVDRRRLKPVTPAELATLEVYCFANCASQMEYVDRERALPRIESFGNEHDLVARLGMLATRPEERDIDIAGPRFRHHGAWGHLLNAHYLSDIDRSQRERSEAGTGPPDSAPYTLIDGTAPAGTTPQLFRYLNGADAIT
jgi:hypothetical protein